MAFRDSIFGGHHCEGPLHGTTSTVFLLFQYHFLFLQWHQDRILFGSLLDLHGQKTDKRNQERSASEKYYIPFPDEVLRVQIVSICADAQPVIKGLIRLTYSFFS